MLIYYVTNRNNTHEWGLIFEKDEFYFLRATMELNTIGLGQTIPVNVSILFLG
jgi:hypothetical protein